MLNQSRSHGLWEIALMSGSKASMSANRAEGQRSPGAGKSNNLKYYWIGDALWTAKGALLLGRGGCNVPGKVTRSAVSRARANSASVFWTTQRGIQSEVGQKELVLCKGCRLQGFKECLHGGCNSASRRISGRGDRIHINLERTVCSGSQQELHAATVTGE